MNIDCSSMCLLYLIDAFLMTLKRRIALLINETIRSIYSTYQSALQIEYFIKYSMIEWWVEVWMSQSSTLRYEQRFVGSMDWKKRRTNMIDFFYPYGQNSSSIINHHAIDRILKRIFNQLILVQRITLRNQDEPIEFHNDEIFVDLKMQLNGYWHDLWVIFDHSRLC